MTTTYENALAEIFAAFNTAWQAGTASIVGYIPVIIWPGSDTGVPDASKFWVRISTQGVGSEQSTLAESVVTQGSKRFETFGLIFLQIFAPKRSDSATKSKKLAMLAQNTFRDGTLNVIIRNARIQELPEENGLIRINVVADYEFDEIN